MANMSYCRFENTNSDLADVEEALSEIGDIDEITSDSEREAAMRLIRRCARIADDWADWLEDNPA